MVLGDLRSFFLEAFLDVIWGVVLGGIVAGIVAGIVLVVVLDKRQRSRTQKNHFYLLLRAFKSGRG